MKKRFLLFVMILVLAVAKVAFVDGSSSQAAQGSYAAVEVSTYASSRREFKQIVLRNLRAGNWEFSVPSNNVYSVVDAIKGTYFEALHLPIYSEYTQEVDGSVYNYIRFGSSDHTAKDDLRIRRNIKGIVDRILPKNASTTRKVKIIHDYIVLNYTYSYNQPSIKNMLASGWANCNGYATMFLAMSDAAGIEARYVKGDAYNGRNWEYHGWNEVKANGVWYGLDATWDDAYPNIDGHVAHDYFMVNYNEFYNSRVAH